MSREQFSGWAVKVLGWVGAAVGGAMLTLLLNFSANDVRLSRAEKDISANRQAIETIQTTMQNGGPAPLAKRMDDMQAQINSQYAQTNKKLDDIYQVLLDRR